MGFENRVLVSGKLRELTGVPGKKEELLRTGYLSWPSFLAHLDVQKP